MKTIIYLKGNEEIALQIALEENSKRIGENHYYKEDNITKAVKELSRANLRYNIKSGITSLKNDWISRPANKDDIEIYNNVHDVIEWEFVNEIMNGASRLERGLKAIG